MAPEKFPSRDEEQPNIEKLAQEATEQTPLSDADFENLYRGKERIEELDERLRGKSTARKLTPKEITKLKEERDELAKSLERKRTVIEGVLGKKREGREKE